MGNNGVNLYEVLRGHIGDAFYSPMCGVVTLDTFCQGRIWFHSADGRRVSFDKDGKHLDHLDTECLLFPSKEQRNWEKWVIENPRQSKTWSDLMKNDRKSVSGYYCVAGKEPSATERAALLFLKLRRLISLCYGGTVTEAELRNACETPFYTIVPRNGDGVLEIKKVDGSYMKGISQIAFHTLEMAEEFMSYEDNRQLVYDFYII